MSQYQNIPETANTPAPDDLDNESVEALRARLNEMKRLMSERTAQMHQNTSSTEQVWSTKRYTTGVIDGNFLSVAFGGALIVIVSVSVYAFYNLYNAILKKLPIPHDEL